MTMLAVIRIQVSYLFCFAINMWLPPHCAVWLLDTSHCVCILADRMEEDQRKLCLIP